MVFHFRFRQRCAFHRAPHDRLGAAHQRAAHRHAQELAHNGGFAFELHRQVRIVPLTLDAEIAELCLLYVHPFAGIGAASGAEVSRRDIILGLALGAELLFHLPFDRQAVAVPSRQVRGIKTGHLVRAHDDVLDDLVHRRAEVNVAIRIGRAIMQDPRFGPARLRIGAKFFVQLQLIPALDPVGLALGQAAPHRKLGGRQKQRVAIIAVGQGIGHVGPMAVLACFTEMPGNGHGFFSCVQSMGSRLRGPVRSGSARSRAANSNAVYPCHAISVAGSS